jgi:hypothetical protein
VTRSRVGLRRVEVAVAGDAAVGVGCVWH